MIVSARPPTRHLGAPSVTFLSLLPTIERHVGYAFRQVPPLSVKTCFKKPWSRHS